MADILYHWIAPSTLGVSSGEDFNTAANWERQTDLANVVPVIDGSLAPTDRVILVFGSAYSTADCEISFTGDIIVDEIRFEDWRDTSLATADQTIQIHWLNDDSTNRLWVTGDTVCDLNLGHITGSNVSPFAYHVRIDGEQKDVASSGTTRAVLRCKSYQSVGNTDSTAITSGFHFCNVIGPAAYNGDEYLIKFEGTGGTPRQIHVSNTTTTMLDLVDTTATDTSATGNAITRVLGVELTNARVRGHSTVQGYRFNSGGTTSSNSTRWTFKLKGDADSRFNATMLGTGNRNIKFDFSQWVATELGDPAYTGATKFGSIGEVTHPPNCLFADNPDVQIEVEGKIDFNDTAVAGTITCANLTLSASAFADNGIDFGGYDADVNGNLRVQDADAYLRNTDGAGTNLAKNTVTMGIGVGNTVLDLLESLTKTAGTAIGIVTTSTVVSQRVTSSSAGPHTIAANCTLDTTNRRFNNLSTGHANYWVIEGTATFTTANRIAGRIDIAAGGSLTLTDCFEGQANSGEAARVDIRNEGTTIWTGTNLGDTSIINAAAAGRFANTGSVLVDATTGNTNGPPTIAGGYGADTDTSTGLQTEFPGFLFLTPSTGGFTRRRFPY